MSDIELKLVGLLVADNYKLKLSKIKSKPQHHIVEMHASAIIASAGS